MITKTGILYINGLPLENVCLTINDKILKINTFANYNSTNTFANSSLMLKVNIVRNIYGIWTYIADNKDNLNLILQDALGDHQYNVKLEGMYSMGEELNIDFEKIREQFINLNILDDNQDFKISNENSYLITSKEFVFIIKD